MSSGHDDEFGAQDIAGRSGTKRTYLIGSETEDRKRVLSTAVTLPTAKFFVEKFYTVDGVPTLRYWCSEFFGWNGRRYVRLDDVALKGQMLKWLNGCVTEEGKRFPANPKTVGAAIESLRYTCHVDSDFAVPTWLEGASGVPIARECLPVANGILHIPTGILHKHDPKFFVLHGVDFDFDPDAPAPKRWLQFLDEVCGDDVERRQLLQQFAAYLLVADTSQEKALLIIGPKRTGKGVIGDVLTALVGSENVASPTTSSLATEFGLEQLIGKVLALITDARFSGRGSAEVSERLLSIIGRDRIGVSRKYQTAMHVVLNARFVIMSNEIPKFKDDAGALAHRFMILELDKSFYDREDTQLKSKLLEELPGILNWALAGWRSLKTAGRFTQPASSKDTMQDLNDLSSPVSAWLRERCEVGPTIKTKTTEAFEDWRSWCAMTGNDQVGTSADFGKSLKAAGVKKVDGTGCRFYRLRLNSAQPEGAST